MQVRVADVLREIARGGIAGAIAGVLVAGLGGRLLMSVAAVLNPGATGLFTDNGEMVGRFTLQGTLALLLFGGLASGLAAGIVWVVVAPWLLWTGARRVAAAAGLAALIGGTFLVQSDNTDFRILEPDALLIVLLIALAGLVGAAIAWLDARLERLLPRPRGRAWPHLLAYGAIALAGAPFLLLTLGFFVSRETCGCTNPPVAVGWALIGVGLLTAAWWAIRLRTSGSRPPAALAMAGAVGLLAVAVLAGAHLTLEVAALLRGA